MFGVNVTLPVAGSIVYVPTCLPSFIAGNSVASVGSPVAGSMNFAGFSAFTTIGTFPSAPDCCLNVTVSDCGCPCLPVVSLFSPTGVTGRTVGVYLIPAKERPVASSTTWIKIGSGVPIKSLFGVNFTVPFTGSISYNPTTLPSFIAGASLPMRPPVSGFTITIGVVAEGFTSPSPFVNVSFLSCSNPCKSSVVTSSDNGVTVGM